MRVKVKRSEKKQAESGIVANVAENFVFRYAFSATAFSNHPDDQK